MSDPGICSPYWQVIFWTTRRADAFDQRCR
jgi:hypothetical protein